MTSNSPRKVVRVKRVVPCTAQESPNLKSVTFSDDTVETSIGGTQRVGKIKHDLLLHFDTPVLASGFSRNLTILNGKTTPKSSTSARVFVSGTPGKENKDMKQSSQVDSVSKDVSCQNKEIKSDIQNNSNVEPIPKGSSYQSKDAKSGKESNSNIEPIPKGASCQSKDAKSGKESNLNVEPIPKGSYQSKDAKSGKEGSSNVEPIPKGASYQSKDAKSGKESNSNVEPIPKDSSYQKLSISNANNSNIAKVRGSVSPVREKSTMSSTMKGVKTDIKSSLDIKSNVPSNIKISVGSENSTTKLDVNVNKMKTEDSGFTKPLHALSDDRRTTIERIETAAKSPFKTPDGKHARRHTLESRLFATPDCYRDVNLGTPRRMLPVIQDESVDLTEEGQDSCSITVAVRVRPFGQRELADSNTRCAISMCGNETTVTTDNGGVYRFAYDFSFWSHDRSSADFCGQESVYTRLAQPLLGKAFEGYNTCLFAYGQTGSGKSYSIMGHSNEVGIVPRFCEELFKRAENLTSKKKVKVNVEISFFEIYNEKIHDLLASIKDKGAKKTVLKVREHPVLGPYVEGLSTYVVNSFDDVEGWITLGNKNRATAATGMNDKSSRSHSVFTIVLTQTKTENIDGQEHDHSVNSKINLVDLAGSERQSLANTSGERLREGANINKSLLTLGKVISLLSERSVNSKKRKIFIPYRDSVLTWLLKESLGGNSKTAMIAAISPSNHHSEETLSTLRYAQQAQSIVNVVRINEDPKAKIIRQLRAEIERLRAEQGGMMNEKVLAASMCEIARLRSEMDELSRSWQERLRQAEARKAEELQSLERSGITFKVNNRLPSLVNLNEDPQLSEMLLYVIKNGETRVGREIDESQHDIKLTGALIADCHCVINCKNNEVKIRPIGDASTYINGDMITETTIIHHGDRVIFGGVHYFRFNHPTELQNKTDSRGSSEIKDFDFAKQELHRVQEARLQAELEGELEKTRIELSKQKDGYENKLKGLENVLTKVEETHREAQTTIDSLKKQNKMLEQEVVASRKHQKMESASSQKALTETELTRSKIVELLEVETKNAAERLDKLRNKRFQFATPVHLTSSNNNAAFKQTLLASSPVSRQGLYKTALLLREANKINQFLKTNLTFKREDILQSEGSDTLHTRIQVTNTSHRMFTYWTTAKFEEKLAQMRDLYQNGGDTTADDDEIFNDPDDVWEKETSMSSPVGQQSSWKISPKTDSMSKTSVNTFTKGSVQLSSQRSSLDVEMIRACKGLLCSVGDNLTALNFEESLVDKILNVCHRINNSAMDILNNGSYTGTSSDKNWSSSVLQLVADVHLLVSQTTLWSSFYDGLQPVLLRDLLSRSTEQVKVIAHQATSLFQGCEGRLTSLMSESVHKLNKATLSLCEICGELSLTVDSHVLRLEQSTSGHAQTQLSSEICQCFLNGCSNFIGQLLKGGLTSIENCAKRCSDWKENEQSYAEMFKYLSHVLSCLQDLLSKTLHVQRQLDQEASEHRPLQYYTTNYKRLQGVVMSVSAIVDSSTLLLEFAESIILGTSHDGKRLDKCAELIQKSLQRLVSASSYSYTPSSSTSSTLSSSTSSSLSSLNRQLNDAQNSSSSNSRECMSSLLISSSQSDMSTSSTCVTSSETSDSDLTDVMLLSEPQLGQIESAVHEVSMAVSLFIEHIHKILNNSLDAEPATPQGKLYRSPEKTVVTPAMNAARLKRQNIIRTVTLACNEGQSL